MSDCIVGLDRREQSCLLQLTGEWAHPSLIEEEVTNHSGVFRNYAQVSHLGRSLTGIRFPGSWSALACWSWALENAGHELAAYLPPPFWKMGQTIAILGWNACGENAETVILPSGVHATVETDGGLITLRSLHFSIQETDGMIKARAWARERGLLDHGARIRRAA
jgi:hypothetical protein